MWLGGGGKGAGRQRRQPPPFTPPLELGALKTEGPNYGSKIRGLGWHEAASRSRGASYRSSEAKGPPRDLPLPAIELL